MITGERIDGILVLRISGRLDAATGPAAEAAAASLLAPGDRSVVLDMSEVDFVASAGLRAVIVIMRAARGARFAACGLRPHVRDVFEISGLGTMLRLCATQDEARASLGA